MPTLSLSRLSAHRAVTFHTAPGTRIASASEAVCFVNERGFAYFWPIKGVDLPSLWVAAAGDRPVPDEHDDPGHVTWDWKDSLLDKGVWYYGRLLRRRNTMVSLELLPNFYALSPNYGDPENDYLERYEQGLMTLETRQVYEALLREGPLDTLALRRAARLAGETSAGRFNRALEDLQIELRILPVGISQAGAWHYAFIYDLLHRRFPDLVQTAGAITEPQARLTLATRYLRSVGACQPKTLARLFGWNPETLQRTEKALLQTCTAVEVTRADQPGPWLCLPELAE